MAPALAECTSSRLKGYGTATKGRLIRCTVPGLTPNLAAILRTPGCPGAPDAFPLMADSRKGGTDPFSSHAISSFSLEGDPACVAKERAVTQQPADRGGINVVSASDISLRLASGQPL